MKRVTVVVEGPLAFAVKRAEAARAGSFGLEVTTFPRLAARLAGGFIQPSDTAALMPAVISSLEEGGLPDLAPVLGKPGLPRAVLKTLRALWAADVDLSRYGEAARLRDMRTLEGRIRDRLPICYLTDRDLRDAALAKANLAGAILGSISIENVLRIEPVWQPLLIELSRHVPLSWTGGKSDRADWFPGLRQPLANPGTRVEAFHSCSDPNAEVTEALRWIRSRLSNGNVKASDVAIAAVDSAKYDEALLVARRSGALPIYFTHGVPALSTGAGQVCAALADLLTRGVNRNRVMRFLNGLGDVGELARLPAGWRSVVPRGAPLESSSALRDTLSDPGRSSDTAIAVAEVLLPLVELFEQGPTAAGEIGDRLLRGEALAIWKRALTLGPPHAIGLTLQNLRLPDEGDPAGCVAWGPADHIANAPRSIVRLLGLSANGWPRRETDDPILPGHILARAVLFPVPTGQMDRASFEVLREHAVEFVGTYPRRSSRGTLQTPGSLWPGGQDSPFSRLRVPDHAFSENDRLMARPADAILDPRVIRSRAVWSNWLAREITAHDGLTRPDHPVIAHALTLPLSSAAMRRLLRDQLAFAWSEGMGWRPRRPSGIQLSLSAAEFGSLVHEILSRGLAQLELGGGIAAANVEERESALSRAAASVGKRWNLERAVPPAALWNAILNSAISLGLSALSLDEDLVGKVETWTEVGFGGVEHGGDRSPPWPAEQPIPLADTDLNLSGRIDRLDLARTKNGFMVTDYKTGAMPVKSTSVLDGGRGIQPLLYVVAGRTHFPDAGRMVARIVYLAGKAVAVKVDGDELDAALDDLAAISRTAVGALRSGLTLSGPDALDGPADFRLALPADLQIYRRTKSVALAALQKELAFGWRK